MADEHVWQWQFGILPVLVVGACMYKHLVAASGWCALNLHVLVAVEARAISGASVTEKPRCLPLAASPIWPCTR